MGAIDIARGATDRWDAQRVLVRPGTGFAKISGRGSGYSGTELVQAVERITGKKLRDDLKAIRRMVDVTDTPKHIVHSLLHHLI
jgi:hypothetical protein